jgi:hypothetical protein
MEMVKVKTKSKRLKKSSQKKSKKKKVYIHHVPVTERELTSHLNEDLQEAWLKIREFASNLGPQEIYASGKAIMFSKSVCYFFVRPKKSYLEVVLFMRSGQLRNGFKSVQAVSKIKYAHNFKLIHADQVEGELSACINTAYSECPS